MLRTCTSCGVPRLDGNYPDGGSTCRFCVDDPEYGPRMRASRGGGRGRRREFTDAERAQRREGSRSDASIEARRGYARDRKRVLRQVEQECCDRHREEINAEVTRRLRAQRTDAA